MATDETIIEELQSTAIDLPKENEEFSVQERFEEVDGGASLSDDGLLAKYCFRTLSKYPIIYGYKRYSYGTHAIRFQIEKRGDLRSFFGINTSLERVNRVISTEIDNRSLHGWWGLNTVVINAKLQRSKEKNDIERRDELTLTLKCDQQQIELEHHRTNRIFQIPIDLTICPFPWKIIVELPSYGDCVRILPSSHFFSKE